MKEKFTALAQYGAANHGGMSRLALSDADKQARDVFVSWLEEAGLTVSFDDGGNLYGYRAGLDPEANAVMIGSHLDTVFEGGQYDGITGVMGALEVMDTLCDRNTKTKRPLILAVFTNEEGARFQPALLGSGLATGKFTKEFVYSRQDKDGKLFADELVRIGYQGEEKNRLKPPHAYLELHIEQGPVLDAEKLSLGVVEGINAMTWYEVTIYGQADHAGPTPMNMRHDALAAAVRIISQVQELAYVLGHDSVTTVGQLKVEPNIVNVIPGKVSFTVDIRSARNEALEQGSAALQQIVRHIAEQEKVEFSISEMWRVDATKFNPHIVDTVEAEIRSLGYTYKRMTSGAGHDAQYMAQIAPTGMIFVPSIGGKSHTEVEKTSWADIENGVQVLLNTACKLANE
jgi:N-carbamoyl-L-amino-acid hydrolase